MKSLPDLSRQTPVGDLDDHHLYLALGCAAENLMLAASACGHRGAIRFDIANDGVVTVSLEDGTTGDTALSNAIPNRHSARAKSDGRPVGTADL